MIPNFPKLYPVQAMKDLLTRTPAESLETHLLEQRALSYVKGCLLSKVGHQIAAAEFSSNEAPIAILDRYEAKLNRVGGDIMSAPEARSLYESFVELGTALDVEYAAMTEVAAVPTATGMGSGGEDGSDG